MAKRLTAFLILCLLVSLFGCSHNSPQSSVSSSAYALCATTSSYSMAESEDGIYTSFLGHLYYADKDNLSSWTPFAISQIVTIPKRPLSADAKISGSGFYLQQNRIYYCDSDSNYGGSYDLLILSMSPSGGVEKLNIRFPSPAKSMCCSGETAAWRTECYYFALAWTSQAHFITMSYKLPLKVTKSWPKVGQKICPVSWVP